MAGGRVAGLAVVLALAGCIHAARAQGGGGGGGGVQTSGPQAKNLGGELLILDAGSLTFRGNHPMTPGYTTVDACARACASVPGCNAYNFCGRQGAGCGSGCANYVKSKPKLPSDMRQSGGLSAENRKLPITAFGPWTQPYGSNGCQFTYATAASGGAGTDAWPYGMCSLKTVKDPSNPPYLSPSGGGWNSGTISIPSQCAGLSAAACSACLSSASPSDCLACLKDPRAQVPDAVSYLQYQGGSSPQKGCALCANVTDRGARQQCMKCLLGKEPCAYCLDSAASSGPAAANLAPCLDCVAKRGAGLRGACASCAQSEKQSGRCFSCLGELQIKTCPEDGSYKAPAPPAPPACWSATDSTPCGICSSSSKSDGAFRACWDCFKSSDGARDECQSCSYGFGMDAAAQERCFRCAAKSGAASSSAPGCAPCFYSWVGAGNRDRCLACVEDASTPQGSRFACANCVGNGRSQQAGDQCVSCLKGGASDPQGQCVGGGAGRH